MYVKIITFFEMSSPFSNFHKAPFTQDGKYWICSEQYYLYHQAVYCGDIEIANAIYKSRSPFEMKKLSKGVDKDKKAKWFKSGHADHVMNEALMFKFDQNEDLRRDLLSTDDSVLVEASPYDDYWGVQLSARDKRILDPSMWRGKNILGNHLMYLRSRLGGEGSPLWKMSENNQH